VPTIDLTDAELAAVTAAGAVSSEVTGFRTLRGSFRSSMRRRRPMRIAASRPRGSKTYCAHSAPVKALPQS
jgi:hypothetical protein